MGLENQSLGQPGEMDNEVLIGKAKTGFPGRAIAMRWGKKPFATEQDLTGRGRAQSEGQVEGLEMRIWREAGHTAQPSQKLPLATMVGALEAQVQLMHASCWWLASLWFPG